MVNVPAFTTYCGLGAERIGPIKSQVLRRSLRQRSQIVRRRSHLRHPPHHHHNSNVPKRLMCRTSISRRIRRRLIPNGGVDGCGRMHVGHQEIADGAGTLLDPESGSSYDDSEFSDDDDAEYLVTSAKRRFSRIYQMMSYHLK
ncbi:hypothetical protein EVAR_98791_1 [Eumeta japonica]|uniref:Uncharacterized protein n=1 Tax=Eumeta variegata TaxID=151549 RepID=A0A4C2A1V6_EUMVA|nr:hypothetical protein EVAR_98791_1 [Eumeta japonica]